MEADALQKMLDQIRDAYLAELPERLDQLEGLLLAMESNPAAGAPYREVFRIVHSIKGSGGTHGLHPLTTICHAFEDFLQAKATKGGFSRWEADHSLAYVDLLRKAAGNAQKGIEDPGLMLDRLKALREAFKPQVHRVLLLEPSRFSSVVYQQGLEGLPLDVIQMGDGYQALFRLLKEPFHLLITSNELETLNGPAVLSALRLSTSVNAHIKAILLTSSLKKGRAYRRKADANLLVPKDGHTSAALRQGVQSLLGLQPG